MKKTLAVLFGGCSSEYEVSLHSAAAVIDAVDRARYELLTVGITRSGQWLLYPGGTEAILQDSWWRHADCVPALLSPSREDHGLWLAHADGWVCKPLDLVFPVLHGKNGEDGTVQGLLELAGIPFVGCGCLCSALCMDKQVAHALAGQAGIACPPFITVHHAGQPLAQLAQEVTEGMGDIPMPWFVKPAAEGSSFGVSRVQTPAQLPAALDTALRYGKKLVVEQGIRGFEVGCAIMGDAEKEDSLFVGAVDAIALEGGFFDFHEKYTLETAKILLPAPVEGAVAEKIIETARRLYRLFGCRGLARVDLFLSEAGEVIFNEINTLPGMTPHSRYPGMMRTAGLPFEAMLAKLLEQEA